LWDDVGSLGVVKMVELVVMYFLSLYVAFEMDGAGLMKWSFGVF